MATFQSLPESLREPLVLTVPGLSNSGQGHWQTIWEQEFDNCRRVDLGLWDDPHRNTWVNKLNLAIRRADRPVVLAAHSLGCLAVAWWAEYEQPGPESPVVGALLVAPPDVEDRPLDRRLTRFAPFPSAELPFPSILVASRNDPYLGFGAARRLADTWGSAFADAGATGHVNAESGLGEWTFGQVLLSRLLPPGARAVSGGKRPLPHPGTFGAGRGAPSARIGQR